MTVPHRPLISIQNASKAFDDEPDRIVLNNISFDIDDGEFVIVFGPSGSGKSTILNLLAGLEKPTSGRVMVRRRDLTQFDNDELAYYHRQKMGMVFQAYNLIKSLKVWENVALPQTANGVPYRLRKRRARRLLKLFNVEQYMFRRPPELSGGEQQRVAIARALINDPFFLLIDEPTGNLDSKAAAEVMHLLQGLNAHAQHTIVMVTHNQDQLHYASRIIHVKDGQIEKEERHDTNPDTVPKVLEDHFFEELSQFKEVPGLAYEI